MRPLSVHILQGFDDEWIESLKEQLDDNIKLTSGSSLPEDPDYDLVVAGRPSKEFLEASPNMKAVVIPWAGLPVKTRELLLEYPDIAVYNLHHNAAATAETAIALMLAAAKEIVPIDRALRSHDWRPRYRLTKSISLHGKRAVILGYGAIGKRLGSACRGLGMETIGVTRTGGATSKDIVVDSVASLDYWLPQADVLFVTVPLTEETNGLLGRDELALLPDNAILINVARGPIIDQQALYEELKSGRIRAGIDVWYNYPKEESDREHCPPSDYPFHELDTVVMTPHIGGNALDIEPQRMAELADLLNTAARGEQLPNRADPKRGY